MGERGWQRHLAGRRDRVHPADGGRRGRDRQDGDAERDSAELHVRESAEVQDRHRYGDRLQRYRDGDRRLHRRGRYSGEWQGDDHEHAGDGGDRSRESLGISGALPA